MITSETLFIIFVNYLDLNLLSKIPKCDDDIKVGHKAGHNFGRDIIQPNLDGFFWLVDYMATWFQFVKLFTLALTKTTLSTL